MLQHNYRYYGNNHTHIINNSLQLTLVYCTQICLILRSICYLFWHKLPEVESRTQGSRPRLRTQKKSEAKDSLSEDRHSRGQGQECSRTKDTSASALRKKKGSSQKFIRRSTKKKRPSQKFFRQSPQKNVFQKIFQILHKILTVQKIVLSSSRGQANFRGLEASRPRT